MKTIFKEWGAVILATLVTTLAIGGAYELSLKISRDEKLGHKLRVAATDIRAAVLWEQSGGTEGQVNVAVVVACARADNQIAAYAGIWGADEEDLAAYKQCPLALLAAMRYGRKLGGEYGCSIARRALAEYADEDAQELYAAAKESEPCR